MAPRKIQPRRSLRLSLLAAIQTQPTASKASIARSSGHCVRTVARWSARLASGDVSLQDAARSGRPRRLAGSGVTQLTPVHKTCGAPSCTISTVLLLWVLKGKYISMRSYLCQQGRDSLRNVSLTVLQSLCYSGPRTRYFMGGSSFSYKIRRSSTQQSKPSCG